jgi:hypothetical protein
MEEALLSTSKYFQEPILDYIRKNIDMPKYSKLKKERKCDSMNQSTKRSRMEARKNKLKQPTKYGYWAVVWHEERDKPESRVLLKSYSRGGDRVRFFKNYSNRKVRRYRGEIGNGSQYKRVFDYWWKID